MCAIHREDVGFMATIDRYGHLLPGGEAEAAELLNESHARRHRR